MHEGEKATKTIWGFNGDQLKDYSLEVLERQIGELFPHVAKKHLKLKLFHYDELAGKVYIDSDADVTGALENFVEEWEST